MSVMEKWWLGLLALSFIGIRYNEANGAIFVVVLFGGLVAKSIF